MVAERDGTCSLDLQTDRMYKLQTGLSCHRQLSLALSMLYQLIDIQKNELHS